MSNYKIGDHVVCEKSNVPGWNYRGKTGVINKIDVNYAYPYRCEMDDGSDDSWCTVSGLVEEKKVFTKKDLQNGDVIKKRNGNIEILVLPLGSLVCNDGNFNLFDDVKDDLTSKNGYSCDIVAVRRPTEVKDCRFYAFKYNFGDLVYDRERDTKKPLYNGKVICTSNFGNTNAYTVGKIYQFKDGILITNKGGVVSNHGKPFTSFTEFNNFSASEWIEIKE